MNITIQGYLEGYNLSYTIEDNTSVVANTSNIYRFQIDQENIDQSIWKPDYPNKTISFYNTTTRVLETRILKNTDYYYYATVPNSVLTSKGRLYVTINFFNEDYGVVTKEMDNPILIQASERNLPIQEEDQKAIRYETSLNENHLEIPSDFYYIDNYASLLQVYYEGKLLSSSEYSIDLTTHILTLKDSIFVQGGRIILILHVPCDCGEGGSVAVYAEEAGFLSNKLIIGEVEYDGRDTRTLPAIPSVIEDLSSNNTSVARKTIEATKTYIQDEDPRKNPNNIINQGDIWIIEDNDENLVTLPKITPDVDEGKVVMVRNNEWSIASLPDYQSLNIPQVNTKDNGKVLGVIDGKWDKLNLEGRLLADLSTVRVSDESSTRVYAAMLKDGKYQWSLQEASSLFTPKFISLNLSTSGWHRNEQEGYYTQSVDYEGIDSNSVVLATPEAGSYLAWANNSVHLSALTPNLFTFRSYIIPSENISVNVVYFGQKSVTNTAGGNI